VGGGSYEACWATLLFSAKESVYKCYYPLTGAHLGFLDVEVCVDPEQRSFSARLLRADAPSALGARRFRGRFAREDGCVWTGVALGSEEVDLDAA
jgi:4'-phosphopantetheinyl transferase EntD